MGGKCCTDRNKSTEKVGLFTDEVSDRTPQIKKSVGHRQASGDIMKQLALDKDSKMRPSQFLGVTGDDAHRFDQAFVNQDVQAFIELVASTNKLGQGQLDAVPTHPWAMPPATVGALAITQLSVLASRRRDNDNSILTIRQAGACQVLAEVFKAGKESSKDLRDAAVVLMVILTCEDAESCTELGDLDCIPTFLRFIDDKEQSRGFRSALSTILVNIMCEHQASANRFIREDGALPLIKACDSFGYEPGEEKFFDELLDNILELTENQESGAASRFLPHIRKAVAEKPDVLSNLARKFPGTEVEGKVNQLMELAS